MAARPSNRFTPATLSPRSHPIRGLSLLAAFLLTSMPASSTTIVAFYDQVNGAILGADSAKLSADASDSDNATLMEASVGCKIRRCGKYFLAIAGFSGVEGGKGRDITDICRNVASSAHNIDAFVNSLLPEFDKEATIVVGNMVFNKRPPKLNFPFYQFAAIGYEDGSPVLRVRERRITELTENTVRWGAGPWVDCPSTGPQCKKLHLPLGIRDEIVAADNQGRYNNQQNAVLLPEQFIQTEIDAHKSRGFVLPPVSIVQIKDDTPVWLRDGLCVSEAAAGTYKNWLTYLGFAFICLAALWFVQFRHRRRRAGAS